MGRLIFSNDDPLIGGMKKRRGDEVHIPTIPDYDNDIDEIRKDIRDLKFDYSYIRENYATCNSVAIIIILIFMFLILIMYLNYNH